MSGSATYVPKKKWWVVAVALPIVLALIALVPSVVNRKSSSGEEGRSTTIQGSQFNGDVFYHSLNTISDQARETLGHDLPADLLSSLREAMRSLESKQFESAVPLLEVVAEKAPLPGVLNNLGVAHLGAGNRERARVALERAITNRSGGTLANSNLMKLRDRIHESAWAGVEAELTRFDGNGGMITVEVTFRNKGSKDVVLDLSREGTAYLLDEQHLEKWFPSANSRTLTNYNLVEGGGQMVAWGKFRITNNIPSMFTAVFPGLARPFERLSVPK